MASPRMNGMTRLQKELQMVMGHALHQSTVCSHAPLTKMFAEHNAAEFRGPGVHHNFDDSDSGYDVDMDSRKPWGQNQRGSGRIILLGDSSEVLTDSDDTEMFDHSEEDKDLDSQAPKGQSKTKELVTPDKIDASAEPKVQAASDGKLDEKSSK